MQSSIFAFLAKNAWFSVLLAHSALLQLGALPRTDSDDQQKGIFWIDVLEGSSMCNVTGLTMASIDISVVLICSISIPIGVILIVAGIFVILWCYRKKQRNADIELQ